MTAILELEPTAVESPWRAKPAPDKPRLAPTELDARGPSPPDPLQAILAALAALPAGQPQFVRTRSDPSALLQALATRGVQGVRRAMADGSWRARVWRP